MSQEIAPPPRLAALRSYDFRRLWLGEMVSTVGSQMQVVAIDWHVATLLRGQSVALSDNVSLDAQALGLGLIGLSRVIPIIIFALVGGVLADVVDRRKLMVTTRIIAALLASLLAFITLAGRETVGVIYLFTAAGSAIAAFDSPARQSLIPNLVPREHLSNAISLNTLMWQVGTIVGPAVTGVLVAQYNIGLVYAINAVTFLVAIWALASLRYRGERTPLATGVGLGALMEGLRFVRNTRLIWSTMLLDFCATFFSSARTMLPIVVTQVLGLGVESYGLLATAAPVGSVLAGSVVALRKEIQNQGKVLLVSVAIYGLATVLFGLSTSLVLSYLFYALTGASDTVSTVIRSTLRQLLTPDHLRGRMTSVNMIFFMGGPQLGELEAGLVASAFSAPFAIVTGGLATVLLTAWIAWKYPRLRNYTGETAKAAV
jgi:MFS family permease